MAKQNPALQNFVRGFLADRGSPAHDERKARARLLDSLAEALSTRDTIAELENQVASSKAEMQRLRGLLTEQTAQRIEQQTAKPENVEFIYHREVNGLLSRVILKAEGYDDVAVDVVRSADNRMRQLKVNRPDTPAGLFAKAFLK